MKKGILMKGYTIRIQRGDAGWKSEKQFAWAPAGQVPTEWEQVKADPDVKSAEIFPNSQRHLKPWKRKLTDEFTRQSEQSHQEEARA